MYLKPLACLQNSRFKSKLTALALIAGVAMLTHAGIASAATASITYSYDTQGRVTKAVYAVSGTTTLTFVYHYDAAGNFTSFTAS